MSSIFEPFATDATDATDAMGDVGSTVGVECLREHQHQNQHQSQPEVNSTFLNSSILFWQEDETSRNWLRI